jgi:hypothetical protein
MDPLLAVFKHTFTTRQGLEGLALWAQRPQHLVLNYDYFQVTLQLSILSSNLCLSFFKGRQPLFKPLDMGFPPLSIPKLTEPYSRSSAIAPNGC